MSPTNRERSVALLLSFQYVAGISAHRGAGGWPRMLHLGRRERHPTGVKHVALAVQGGRDVLYKVCHLDRESIVNREEAGGGVFSRR